MDELAISGQSEDVMSLFISNPKLQCSLDPFKAISGSASITRSARGPSCVRHLTFLVRFVLMYVSLQNRYRAAIDECYQLLEEAVNMAPPGRAINANTRPQTPTLSNASSPSLRSRTPVSVPVTPVGSSMRPGGNVKVVVRVRGFLPRGELPVVLR
jgi:hypothetical protein